MVQDTTVPLIAACDVLYYPLGYVLGETKCGCLRGAVLLIMKTLSIQLEAYTAVSSMRALLYSVIFVFMAGCLTLSGSMQRLG